jgi:hypothetical protein
MRDGEVNTGLHCMIWPAAPLRNGYVDRKKNRDQVASAPENF